MDKVFEEFLQVQHRQARKLNESSDLVSILPVDGIPPRAYLVEFRCAGLVREDGVVKEAHRFLVGIRFSEDYLRRVEPASVITLLAPQTTWHPNIQGHACCIGMMPPGTGLRDLVHQLHEILTWSKVTMEEWNALNKAACSWARRNLHRFPIDRRPLMRGGYPTEGARA